MSKNKVGRPISINNRTKVGLSLDGAAVNMLSSLSEKTGKTKSKVVTEAIALYAAELFLVELKNKRR